MRWEDEAKEEDENDDEMRVTALLTGFYNSVEHVVGFVSRRWLVGRRLFESGLMVQGSRVHMYTMMNGLVCNKTKDHVLHV